MLALSEKQVRIYQGQLSLPTVCAWRAAFVLLPVAPGPGLCSSATEQLCQQSPGQGPAQLLLAGAGSIPFLLLHLGVQTSQ